MPDLIPPEVIAEQDARIDEYIDAWTQELEEHLIENRKTGA